MTSLALVLSLLAVPLHAAELFTSDGWTLKADWAPPQEGKLTFVLLHGVGGSRADWGPLAEPLQRAGYGTLALDMRGHGASAVDPSGAPRTWRDFKTAKDANDFVGMAKDLEAAVAWLGTQGVGDASVAFIGADLGGSLALKHGGAYPRTPLVVLLSPGLAYRDIPVVNAARMYKNRPILMVYSVTDKTSSASVPVLYAFAQRAAGADKTAKLSVPEGRGTGLLSAQADLPARIVAWVGNPVGGDLTAPAAP